MKVRPVSDKRVIRPSGAPLLGKWQDFFRVRRHSGGTRVRLLRGPSPSRSTVRRPVVLAYDIRTVQELLGDKDVKTTMVYTHVLNRVAGEVGTARSTGCGCPYPARHGGSGRATGRPKKMQATHMIDHKWPYNENVSPPQSWGCLVLGPSSDGLSGSA